jgi:hypothetical protein
MSLPVSLKAPAATSVGNAAGWALAFFEEETSGDVPTGKLGKPIGRFSREGYYAEIEATLPGDLTGGLYKFTIEGLSDEDHRKIQGGSRKLRALPTMAVKLYLYWRDANASVAGYLASVGGLTDLVSGGGLVGAGSTPPEGEPLSSVLVAVLSVTSVDRQAGPRRYQTVIEATERAFAFLDRQLAVAGTAADRTKAAEEILKTAGIDNTIWPAPPKASSGPAAGGGSGVPTAAKALTWKKGETMAQVLVRIAKDLEAQTNKQGRGQLLIRKGALNVGVRKIPLEGKPTPLDLGGGLVEAKLLRKVLRDPNFDSSSNKPAPTRNEYQLTLKGRGDLKPGDIVSFEPPPASVDASVTGTVVGVLSGALGGGSLVASLTGGGKTVSAYVSSVRHRLGRRVGFSTVVTCLGLVDDADDGWDEYSPGGSSDNSGDPGSQDPAAHPALDAARTLKSSVKDATAQLSTAEVGEVRATYPTKTADADAQTTKVWRGLTAPDGNSLQATRQEIQRETPEAVNGVPYLTPFAWGKCGLILPRYPGTRVVMVHRNGQAGDPVDVGATWAAGTASTKAQAGDWWLALPTEAPHPQSLGDTDKPDEYTGNASNDLIDAKGNRTIEVAGLTIRVGAAALKGAGERPRAPADSEALTIEHGDEQSKIVLKKGGAIEIHAKEITLATEGVTATLDSKKLDVS